MQTLILYLYKSTFSPNNSFVCPFKIALRPIDFLFN
nr:MAG TPA: hypothetical protein [Bacteriophage sp.]